MDIGCTGDLDVVTSQLHIDSNELRENRIAGEVYTFADLSNDFAGSGCICAGHHGEVIDLTADEDMVIIDGSLIDVAFVCRKCKPEVGQDAADMPFP